MRKKIRIVVFVLALLVFLVCIGMMVYYFINRYKDKEEINELKGLITTEEQTPTTKNTEPKTPTSTVIDDSLDYYLIDGVVVQKKYKDVYLKNHDFVGWVSSENTQLDDPVVYTPNDTGYYLRKDFNGKYNISGTVFVGGDTDLVRPSENTILYGHKMSDGSKFGSILNYSDEDYYREHKYIQFDSLTRNGTYEVIASFKTVAHTEDENYTGFDVYKGINMSEERFNDYIKQCMSMNSYDTTHDLVQYNQKLLTLSTCSYHSQNGRFVVIARLVKEQTVDTTRPPIEVINTK